MSLNLFNESSSREMSNFCIPRYFCFRLERTRIAMTETDWLTQHQTWIVGIVGFTGVILTLIVNANLARAQFVRSSLHQANVMRRAMLADLRSVASSLQLRIEHAKRTDHKPGSKFLAPTKERLEIYDHSIVNIGLLTSAEVSAVITAYGWIRTLPEGAAVLSESTTTVHGYYDIRLEHSQLLILSLDDTLQRVQVAIRELTAELGPV